jgi:glycosyltransferase involved in cell wall biosynthesis
LLGHNNIVAALAKRLSGTATRIVVCQHSSLADECRGASWKYRLLPFLYRIIWTWADAVVAVSRGAADGMASLTGIPRRHIEVIYNPVLTQTFDALYAADVCHPFFELPQIPVFVAIGRLVWPKNFEMAIESFAAFRRKENGRLLIIGDGPLRLELEQRCVELGVAEEVDFLGFQPNVIAYMRRASALILSSVYEGFGNVLIEAMAAGTPVISTDCPHGPRELLCNGRFGTLVPVGDTGALTDAMTNALSTSSDMLERARIWASAFTDATAAGHYAALFNRLLETQKRRMISDLTVDDR